MGAYVNPSNETKEQFLLREGRSTGNLSWAAVPPDHLPVILMDNGMFTAAGIAYCESELREFTSPTDRRPRRIYYVPTAKLLTVSKELASYISRPTP